MKKLALAAATALVFAVSLPAVMACPGHEDKKADKSEPTTADKADKADKDKKPAEAPKADAPKADAPKADKVTKR